MYMSLRYLVSLLSITLLLSGCSSVKSLFGSRDKKKRADVETADRTVAAPSPEPEREPGKERLSHHDEGKPIEPDVAGQIVIRKNRPKMTFGETESANVKVPLVYNNPFLDSDELVVPLGELKEEFCYPYPGKLISPFGRRGRSMHTGIDIKAVPNDTIRAAMPGVVRMSKYYGGYGNVVVIRHYNGIETVYGHQSKNLVGVNDVVEAGAPIGLAGRTGRATTEHVHFELRVANQPVNPTLLVDPESRTLRDDRTLFCYNRGGRIRVADKPLTASGADEPAASPVQASSSSPGKSAASSSSDPQYYYVKKGDTLSQIALNHSTTVKNLCSLNNLKPTSILQIKQKLRVK